MKLYVESSALLAALLGEPSGERVQRILDVAELVTTSDLTLIECDRALIRAGSLNKLNQPEIADRRAILAELTAVWHILAISDEIVDRARQPFPSDPIRALDAIHLASALVARSGAAGLELLTLDDRIRSAGRSLGFSIQPGGGV